MTLLIFVTIFVVAPTMCYLMGRFEEKKENNENRKRSEILFNSTYIDRNVTSEEVFETLAEAGIAINFIHKINIIAI